MKKSIIAMCALSAVMTGCMTADKKEYNPIGKTWNTINFGVKGVFKGAASGAKEGFTAQDGTNEVSVVGRVWNTTVGTVGGMFKGSTEGMQEGYNMTPEKYQELKIANAKKREEFWKNVREKMQQTQQ